MVTVQGGYTNLSGLIGPALGLLDAGAGFRYTVPAPLSVYASFMGVAYYPWGGAWRFGTTAGFGRIFRLNPRAFIEVGGTYRTLLNPFEQFFTAEVGIGFDF